MCEATTCYRAEWSLGDQPQQEWADLLHLATQICTDPVVLRAYPKLKRPPRLRPMMEARADGVIGEYRHREKRVRLWWNGRDYLCLIHELAHAATAGAGHGPRWQEAHVFLTWRFLGEEMGKRLAAAFLNHNLLQKEVSC